MCPAVKIMAMKLNCVQRRGVDVGAVAVRFVMENLFGKTANFHLTLPLGLQCMNDGV